jgi:hypothetical protein
MSAKALYDQVDDIHRMLIADEGYSAFLDAVCNQQAVEGSLVCDDFMAAKMIYDKAKETGSVEVATAKLATISKALGVVLRRYGMSRQQRRQGGLKCR